MPNKPQRPPITVWVGIGVMIGGSIGPIRQHIPNIIKQYLPNQATLHWAWGPSMLVLACILGWLFWQREIRGLRAELEEKHKLKGEAAIGKRIQAEAKSKGLTDGL